MLHLPNSGHRVFEVALYNKEVRRLVARRQRHSFFEDLWAEQQRRNVVARDEVEARRLISERFPPEEGFVIEGVFVTRY
jgi:hypothetical protein